MKAFCDLNILRLLQKGSKWQDSLYAIGYWAEWGYEKYRVIRFLTKGNPGVDRLLEFKV